MERECNSSAREVTQLRSQNDRLKAEKNSLEQELFETQQSLTELQKEFQQLQDSNKREQEQVVQERRMNEHLVDELSKEVKLFVQFLKLNLFDFLLHDVYERLAIADSPLYLLLTEELKYLLSMTFYESQLFNYVYISTKSSNSKVFLFFHFQLETLKSASFPHGHGSSSLSGDGLTNSYPASMMNGLAASGLNSNSHINELEDELKVLREQNRRLKVTKI
jgi:hypothetical protein